ncbi:hypothetical protein SERLA73DRAFT_178046 [Serpula lacrymans var. lacrymans S7.3]|uniref:Uncharacterized protein n=2 Tax=Serpula lacrymans var. lacrymans TaxID=341189 RepID=F8PQB5_SERL3|nr:uncharacterized protein SERLADRAFT_462226 [Serpula lacrymans var. lacrymans S7.9]EGO02216.1 hypothetical protein SERLA73DRAFT_178046 [Serpula lacrymans var. lacrymans S7.3]EGO27932.1 hypothetical protein SERLADRAFT_462226 [Serpula lacrymans var. lacrymans S7.9]
MIDAVVNKPNRILERQQVIQHSHKPVYYRLPRSRLYLGTYYSLFTLGMFGTTYGIYSLAFGKPAANE